MLHIDGSIGIAIEETGDGMVLAEAGGDGRRAAGGSGLCVLAAGSGLQRDPVRGRVLRAQHGPFARGLRHEPALPDLGPELLELRLPAVRDAVVRQSKYVSLISSQDQKANCFLLIN